MYWLLWAPVAVDRDAGLTPCSFEQWSIYAEGSLGGSQHAGTLLFSLPSPKSGWTYVSDIAKDFLNASCDYTERRQERKHQRRTVTSILACIIRSSDKHSCASNGAVEKDPGAE
jgi:hypothetical protein